jgi:hypothetical protein
MTEPARAEPSNAGHASSVPALLRADTASAIRPPNRSASLKFTM